MLTNKTPWIILLLIWIGGSTWWHVCNIKQLCNNDSQPTNNKRIELPAGLVITDGGRFQLAMPGNFSFAKSDDIANRNSLDAQLDTLALYLLNNPDRHLDITGYYSAEEQNGTAFPNLGIARAEGIKEYLTLKGVPLASMTSTGVQKAELKLSAKGDSILGGLAFGFSNTVVAKSDSSATVATSTSIISSSATSASVSVPTMLTALTEEALAKSQKFSSVFEPIDLYFKSGEAAYIKTDETKKFFKEAIRYLRANKDKKLRLVGFTDNAGPDDINLQLSRERADFVKMRLQKVGIPSDQVIVQAKGEAEPKASNETEIGRKANRRVTVVVIK